MGKRDSYYNLHCILFKLNCILFHLHNHITSRNPFLINQQWVVSYSLVWRSSWQKKQKKGQDRTTLSILFIQIRITSNHLLPSPQCVLDLVPNSPDCDRPMSGPMAASSRSHVGVSAVPSCAVGGRRWWWATVVCCLGPSSRSYCCWSFSGLEFPTSYKGT